MTKSRTPCASSDSMGQPISGRLQTGMSGLGRVSVTGWKRVPKPAARSMAFMVGRWPLAVGRGWAGRPTANSQRPTSQLLRREDHVLPQVAPRAPPLAIQIGVGLPDGLLHVHAQLRG